MANPFPSHASSHLRSERCGHPDCSTPSAFLSRWCIPHGWNERLYGHPAAGPLKPSLWANERRLVETMFEANEDHPGFRIAERWVSDWVRKAEERSNAYRGALEIRRLSCHGISPRTILAEVCAVTLWFASNSGKYPHTVPDIAVSHAVFGLAPRSTGRSRSITDATGRVVPPSPPPSEPTPTALRLVGRHLRDLLAPFIANLTSSVESMRESQADELAAMQTPLWNPLRR